MEAIDALTTRRSIRQYLDQPVPEEILRELLELARYYPSPANQQPLRFVATADAEYCRRIYECLHWAGCLPGYQMAETERPKAYILILGDPSLKRIIDFCSGAAATQLMVGAHAMELASCCLSPVNAAAMCEALEFGLGPWEILYVIALGYGAQSSTTEPMTDTYNYRLDGQGNLIVPKRSAKEISCIVPNQQE